jgi:nicotinamidase-related amidase
MIAKGSFTAALYKDLKIEPADIVLEKPRYGAFHCTDLELILRSRGIDSVIISGMTTIVCAETTARAGRRAPLPGLLPQRRHLHRRHKRGAAGRVVRGASSTRPKRIPGR